MARVGTLAAAVGVVAGGWDVWNYLYSCGGPFGPLLCIIPDRAPTGLEGTVVLTLSVVLIIVSLATFLAPASAFYLSAALAAVVDAIEALNYSKISSGALYVTLALMTLELVLGVAAAARRTAVSEQSHPMNLPVFG